jgi:hypothetical protein
MKTLSYDLTKDTKILYIDTTNKKLHEIIKTIIQDINIHLGSESKQDLFI